MSIAFDLSGAHRVVAANTHYYEKPTARLYLDRVLRYHDLIYLVKGQWLITEGDTDYLLEKDDVLLLSAGHHHYTRLPCQSGTSTICVHVTCEPGDREGNDGALLLPTRQNARGTPAVRAYFDEIVSAFWGGRPHREERLGALFNLLALELDELRTGAADGAGSLAEEIIRLINATPHRNFRVAEVAERFHVSGRTIESAMQRSVGMSFSKYQMERKLEMVAQQLRVEPEVRFSEVAQTFGFCDEFHMSRSFKAKYGVSPSQYRQAPRKP